MALKVAVPTLIGPCYPRCTPTYGPGGSGSLSHRLASGLVPRVEAPPPGNGLLNNLIAYWPGDEASGNLLDAHTNGLDLTDINTVTNDTGHVYATARQYSLPNVEYPERASEALLQAGNVEVTLAIWVYMDSKPAFDNMWPIAKFGPSPDFEHAIYWKQATDRFRYIVSSDGTTYPYTLEAGSFGAPSLSTWYLILAWHDPTADLIYIQVNNGAVDSLACTTGIYAGSAPFAIGTASWVHFQSVWDGRIGPSMMWKSAAGGGGVLSAAARTALWNGGAGLTYAELTT